MEDDDRRGGRGDLLIPLFLVAVFTAVVTAIVQWLVMNPRSRRRLVHRAGNLWLRIERATHQSSRALRRQSREMEEQALQVAMKLWENVEELGFRVPSHTIPSVNHRLYAHGAWMGAAPVLLNDVAWRRILAFLMPDVYEDVVRALAKDASPSKIIPMFENNPVMCAFGCWKTSEAGMPATAMEWDLFLSTDLVHAWESARTRRARREAIGELVDTMIIGHASITDTVQQKLGLCQWGDVRKTPKTQMGGVETGAWMDLFARALMLARSENLSHAIAHMGDEERRKGEEACIQFTFAEELASREAAAVYREVTGAETFSVILEIKSAVSTPWLLKALVGELNRRGVHVAAIGAFQVNDIVGVHEMEQRIDEKSWPGPKEILFLHFAGDLQASCDRGAVALGQLAMFNGASLLTASLEQGTTSGYVYEVDEVLLRELDQYRRQYDLSLGIYVQENDLDAAAAALLSEIMSTHPEMFELGFAWGGLPDQVSLPSGQGDRRGFGSQRLLRRLGLAKTWKKQTSSGSNGQPRQSHDVTLAGPGESKRREG